MSRELELVEAKLPRGPRVSSVPVALVDLFIEGIFQVTCALRVERGFVFSTSLSEEEAIIEPCDPALDVASPV